MSEKPNLGTWELEASIPKEKEGGNWTKFDEMLQKAKEDGKITHNEFDELLQKYENDKKWILDSKWEKLMVLTETWVNLKEFFDNLLKEMLADWFTINNPRDLEMLPSKGYVLPKDVKVWDKLTIDKWNTLKTLSWYSNNPINDDRVNLKEWTDWKDWERIEVDRKEFSWSLDFNTTELSKVQKKYDAADTKVKELELIIPPDNKAIEQAKKELEVAKDNLEKAKVSLETKAKVEEAKVWVQKLAKESKNNPNDPKAREAFEKALQSALTFFASALNKLFHLGINVEELFWNDWKNFKEAKKFVDDNNWVITWEKLTEHLGKIKPENDRKNILASLNEIIISHYSTEISWFSWWVFILKWDDIVISKWDKEKQVILWDAVKLLSSWMGWKNDDENKGKLVEFLNNKMKEKTKEKIEAQKQKPVEEAPAAQAAQAAPTAPTAKEETVPSVNAQKKDESKTETWAKPKETLSETPETSKYKIKSWDTLSKIAKEYDLSIRDIMNANKWKIKNPNMIYAWRTINIPSKKA
ncbi:MAG: LysM protein [uncultured bacterium (gcode 4)]|uniref:LysM protein n=1 Tax=uncultured bacterium (gcode 4) TaxID=1234023 RepID=K2GUQ5_9BACT|nr:MAG: LysM protein [uncultured bacterium (gcode 4)]